MNDEKISSLQAVSILTCFLTGSSITINPAQDAGHDGMIAVLVGWALGYLIILATAAVASMHPGKSIVGNLTDCFGLPAGRAIGFIYAVYFLGLAGYVLNSFGYYEISVQFPETPILFVDICFLVVIAVTVRLGLETLGRMGEIYIVIFFVVVILTFASLFTGFHPDAFSPVLKDGVVPPLKAGIAYAMIPFSEFFIALAVFPNVNDQTKLFSIANRTALFSGALLFLITVRDIMVVGVDLSARNIYPAEKIFRLMPGIDVYPLLDLDVIMVAIIKVAIILYAAVRTLGDVFVLNDFKVLAFPAAALSAAFVQLFNKSIYGQLFSKTVFMYIDIPLFSGMLVLLLIMSLARGKTPGKPDTG